MAVVEKPEQILGAVTLLPELELRDGLVDVFGAAVYQGLAFAGRMQSSQSLALREYPGSLRRARAIVRLCEPILSNRAAKRLDSTLQASYQATSQVREADALSGMLSRLDAGDAQPQLEMLRSQVMSWRLSRYDDRRLAASLLTGIVYVRGLPELFERSLASDVNWNDIAAGARKTYSAARNQFERASSVPDPTHIERLRRWTRDLRFQLELLAPQVEVARRRRARVVRALRPLSRAVHLRALQQHAVRLLPAGDADLLCVELETMAAHQADKALDRATRVFAKSPAKYVKRLRPG